MKGSIINFTLASIALILSLIALTQSPEKEYVQSKVHSERLLLDADRFFNFYFDSGGVLEKLKMSPVEYNTFLNLKTDSVYIYRNIASSTEWYLSPVRLDENYISPIKDDTGSIVRYKKIAFIGIEPVVKR